MWQEASIYLAGTMPSRSDQFDNHWSALTETTTLFSNPPAAGVDNRIHPQANNPFRMFDTSLAVVHIHTLESLLLA